MKINRAITVCIVQALCKPNTAHSFATCNKNISKSFIDTVILLGAMEFIRRNDHKQMELINGSKIIYDIRS